MSNALVVDRLSRRFGRTEAVSELSFGVPEGSIYAFIGPNGAGKTTTIHVLTNLLRPTSGTTTVLGTDSRRLGPGDFARIGYVSENQKLPTWMTFDQLLSFCRPFYPTWDEDLARKLTKRFDLPRNQKLKSFSRGMKMKAALVSSLAYRPRLLLLDEPFGGLDPVVRDELIEGMLELSGERDWTIFISSHNLAEMENLADEVGLIRNGRLVLSEQLTALQQRFREIEVTLSRPASLPPSLPQGWLAARASGKVIRFVESQYENGRTASCVREMFSNEGTYSASAMSLREIFIALARAGEVNYGGRRPDSEKTIASKETQA